MPKAAQQKTRAAAASAGAVLQRPAPSPADCDEPAFTARDKSALDALGQPRSKNGGNLVDTTRNKIRFTNCHPLVLLAYGRQEEAKLLLNFSLADKNVLSYAEDQLSTLRAALQALQAKDNIIFTSPALQSDMLFCTREAH